MMFMEISPVVGNYISPSLVDLSGRLINIDLEIDKNGAVISTTVLLICNVPPNATTHDKTTQFLSCLASQSFPYAFAD